MLLYRLTCQHQYRCTNAHSHALTHTHAYKRNVYSKHEERAKRKRCRCYPAYSCCLSRVILYCCPQRQQLCRRVRVVFQLCLAVFVTRLFVAIVVVVAWVSLKFASARPLCCFQCVQSYNNKKEKKEDTKSVPSSK